MYPQNPYASYMGAQAAMNPYQMAAGAQQMQVVKVEGGYDVTLTNKSEVLAYQNILKAKDAQGQLIPGTFWSDNFFTVIPGESCTVHCTLPADCQEATIDFTGWNSKIIR